MREMDLFVSMLFPKTGEQLIDIKFFPGEEPVKLEEFCQEVHSAFLQADTGISPANNNFVETAHRIPVDRFLEG